MEKLSIQQRQAKAAIKGEQSDACICSAEREQARRLFLQDGRCKMADENSKEYHQEESENYLKAAEEEI